MNVTKGVIKLAEIVDLPSTGNLNKRRMCTVVTNETRTKPTATIKREAILDHDFVNLAYEEPEISRDECCKKSKALRSSRRMRSI